MRPAAARRDEPMLAGATTGETSDAAGQPRISLAMRSDADAVCRFLATARMPADAWRRLFDHHWPGATPEIGYKLVHASQVVGFLCAITVRRQIGAVTAPVTNLGVWSVQPQYRAWSLALLAAALRDPTATYTDLTPTPAVARILERLGFRPLDMYKIVMLPFANCASLLARDATVVTDPVHVRALLDRQGQRLFDDHAPYGCLQLCIAAPTGRTAHIVIKRRVKRCLPLSEVIHCSDADLLVRHLERVKLAALARQRTIALTADARLLSTDLRLGLKVSRPSYFRSPIPEGARIDNLYSELVLLPI